MPAMKKPAAALVPAMKLSNGRTGGKRSSCDFAAPASKVPKVSSEVREHLEEIATAVKLVKGLPASAQDMIVGALDLSLGLPEEDRHDCQARVVVMTGEVLTAHCAAVRQEIIEAEAKVACAASDECKLLAVRDEASSSHQAKAQVASIKQDELRSAVTALKEATSAWKHGGIEQKQGDKEVTALEGKKEQLEAFRSCRFGELKTGTVPPKQTSKDLDMTRKLFCYDPEMIKSLCGALGKVPEVRGTFDNMLIDQFEQLLAKSSAELTASLEQHAPGKAARAAKVSELEAAKALAEDVHSACSEAWNSAHAAEVEASAALETATSDLDKFSPVLEATKAGLARLQDGLSTFESGPISTFKLLEGRTMVVPTPLPVEAESNTLPEDVLTSKDGADVQVHTVSLPAVGA